MGDKHNEADVDAKFTQLIKNITAPISAIQAILIDKGICTREELDEYNRNAADEVKKQFG